MHQLFTTPAAMALLAATAAASPRARLDSADPVMVADSANAFALQNLSLSAVSTVQTWVETEDLDDGEGAADRLINMLVGIADANKDGELTDEEQAIFGTAANEAWSYLAAKGVAESDLDALFNSDDPADANAAGARVQEFLADALPDGDEAAADEMDDFAFGAEAQESMFDSTGNLRLDATYKKRFAVRGGRKVMVRKRVSGTVRLSAKQKISIRKASMKSHGARAMAKRMKSLRVRKSIGL